MAATYLGFQKFPGARSRWAAHQLIFWGCLPAAAITFPLTWGWSAFTSATGSGPGCEMRIRGFKVLGLNALGIIGRLMFHGLDIAGVRPQRRPRQPRRERRATGRAPGGHRRRAGPPAGGPQHDAKNDTDICLQNGAFLRVPLLVVMTVLAWFLLNGLKVAAAPSSEQKVSFKGKHNWLMTWLYVDTCGSFIGLCTTCLAVCRWLYARKGAEAPS